MASTLILLGLGLVVIAALVAYVYGWRTTTGSSTLVKAVVRGGLPVIVLGSLIAAIALPELQVARQSVDRAPSMDREYKRFEYRREHKRSKPRQAKEGGTGVAKPPGIGAGASRPENPYPEELAEETPDVITGGGMPPEADSEAAVTAAPPPAPPPQIEERADAPAKPKDPWDLVPVFYGTDRERIEGAKRVSYNGKRARQLELGRAIVSVPKSHQVPNIERPWALKIPYFNVTIYEEDEDPNKHFMMQEISKLSRADFLKLVRERLAGSSTFKDQAFVFVHGFNTTFDIGVYRTAQIAYDLKFDGAPFLYSWPSGGGVSSYTYDRESSGQSTPYMRDFLKLVINETGAKAVSVIAHSMGNQPVLQVLRDLKASTPEGVIISQVILAAPDVDRDNFENIAKDILGLAKGVTLYVASNDQALEYSRRFHGGVPRAGDVPPGGPIVIDGIDTIDVTAASTDSLGINHSGYAENNALLNDIGRLIATGAAPDKRHPPTFERVGSGSAAYWKYPGSE